MTTPILITLELSNHDANLLACNGSEVFVYDQPDRFEPFDDDDHLSLKWKDGQMLWCQTGVEALLLRSFERASGYEAMILSDLATCAPDPDLTVLSTRPWAETWGERN